MQRLVEVAEADLADLYDEQGNLLHPSKWPDVWRQGLVAGVETFMVPKGEDAKGKAVYAEVRKVKLAHRLRVLELIGKHVQINAFRDEWAFPVPRVGPYRLLWSSSTTSRRRSLVSRHAERERRDAADSFTLPA